MRSVTTTLLTTLLLLFFSTTTSAFFYRKFPYSIECTNNLPDVTRYQLQTGGRDAIRGYRKNQPFAAHAKNSAEAGNCKDLAFPLYLWDIGINDLIIFYAYDEPKNTLWYCNYDVKPKVPQYCNQNYQHHTPGTDDPTWPNALDDGLHWTPRAKRS